MYVTGDLALAGGERDNLVEIGLASFNSTNRQTHSGWTVGGGFERPITRNWSLFSEYLYADLGAKAYTLTTPPGAFRVHVDEMHLIKTGANYRW